MPNPLIRKLEAFGPLPDADKALLDEVARTAKEVEARTDLALEGEAPYKIHLVMDGFACRYKALANGSHHIVAYLLPGDFCDLHAFLQKRLDHSVATLSLCRVVELSRSRFEELTERPAILKGLWWSTLVDEGTLREWLVNIGGRPADQRISHLLCELLTRLETVGMTVGHGFQLPLTQADLGATVGLSNVHVNRIIQQLRADELITLKGRNLVILDRRRLEALAEYDPNYLHLEGGGAAGVQPRA